MLATPSVQVICAACIHSVSDDVLIGREAGCPAAVRSCVKTVDFLRSDVINALMAEPTTRERAYRLRCCPSARQRRALGRLFGASRFAWNWALARRTRAYQVDQARRPSSQQGCVLAGDGLADVETCDRAAALGAPEQFVGDGIVATLHRSQDRGAR